MANINRTLEESLEVGYACIIGAAHRPFAIARECKLPDFHLTRMILLGLIMILISTSIETRQNKAASNRLPWCRSGQCKVRVAARRILRGNVPGELAFKSLTGRAG